MIAWGLVVVVLSLVCWGGQVVSLLAPDQATRLGLSESESEVEPVFWVDARGEAFWDSLVLWVMPVAGILMVADSSWWPYLGLAGGGAYLYFAGRGLAVRSLMGKRDLRIGSAASVRVGLAALAVWGMMAAVTIVVAIVELESLR